MSQDVNPHMDKRSTRIAVTVSIIVHAALALCFFFIAFEIENGSRDLSEIYFIEIPVETPAEYPVTPEPYDNPIVPPEPVTEQREAEADDASVVSPEQPEQPADVRESARSKAPSPPENSIITKRVAPDGFTPLSNGESQEPLPIVDMRTPMQKGETLFPDQPYAIRPSWIPEEKSPLVPPEEVKDYRREFKESILGIPLGGALGVVPLTLVHLTKMIKWTIQDILPGRHKRQVERSHFTVLSERDIRFLILLWRDGLLAPRKLSQRDRMFLTESKGETVRTNAACLDGMCWRGIVTSLEVNREIVYRANFSRKEVYYSLTTVLGYIEDEKQREIIVGMIDLLASCWDRVEEKVMLPE